MPCNALMANPKAEIDPSTLNDMLNDDWVILCLDGTTDDMKQPQAFD